MPACHEWTSLHCSCHKTALLSIRKFLLSERMPEKFLHAIDSAFPPLQLSHGLLINTISIFPSESMPACDGYEPHVFLVL